MIGWFANQKEKKGFDLVVVAVQSKALAANLRNTEECRAKDPGNMKT